MTERAIGKETNSGYSIDVHKMLMMRWAIAAEPFSFHVPCPVLTNSQKE